MKNGTATVCYHLSNGEASSLLNLAALCQKCHNGHDAEARRRGILERREAASGQTRLAW